MLDSIGWIAYNYLFLSLREMHYGINKTKRVCNLSGSGNEKSDGIWANMNCIRLSSSTRMSSNSLKSGLKSGLRVNTPMTYLVFWEAPGGSHLERVLHLDRDAHIMTWLIHVGHCTHRPEKCTRRS